MGWSGMGFTAGTRFRLFPQAPFLAPFHHPETVRVSSPAGTVGPGPADARMYVIDPIGKPMAYGLAEDIRGNPIYLVPPWQGPVYPPALPDADGHFDHIAVDSPEFEAAHLFGAVRRTLDVWEGYFGHRIEWHFARDFDRLELVIQRNLMENAFMGYGFLEVGIHLDPDDTIEPFCLNFDVVAHEVGHCIVYAMVGVPDPGTADAEYYGFHEFAADLTALITALHFDTVTDELLATTHGNLYALNFVNRIAELSSNQQIRLAANPLTLLDFVAGWRDEHALAQPLTGAMFDIFVDLFHEELVARGLITAVRKTSPTGSRTSPTTTTLFSRSSMRRMPPRRRAFALRSSRRATRSAPIWQRHGGGCHPTTSATPMSDARFSQSTAC